MELTTDTLLATAPVIPVVVLDDPRDAVPLATALVAGGLPVIEITLRTPKATEAIRRVADALPDAIVGAGTILAPEHARAAVDAGARFLVSPGTTPTLLAALQDSGLPFLPGAATASEVVALLEHGLTAAKLFPAEALGGTALLRALGGPLPAMRFCPTGGIDAQLAPAYLALPNVPCVGGSWMVGRDLIAAGDWEAIESAARTAAALRGTALRA